MRNYFKSVVLMIMVLTATSLNANQIDSFEKAKKVLPSIFNFHNKDVYCNCPYKEENKIDINLLDSAIYERISYKRCVSELEPNNKARLDFKKFYDELFNILKVK